MSAPLHRSPVALAALAGVVAALVLLPGHDAHGLWSTGELGALQRAQAALGAALSGLERSPWLPDVLRTQALAWSGDPEAIRLPGAIASSALVALAAGLARALGSSPAASLLAGAFALAFPLTLTQGRLALGNPVGELLATASALLLAAALSAPRARALALALAGLGALALSVTASGLWLGVALPLVAAALWNPQDMSRSAGPSGHAPTDMPSAPGGSARSDMSPAPAPGGTSPASASGPAPADMPSAPVGSARSDMSPAPAPGGTSPASASGPSASAPADMSTAPSFGSPADSAALPSLPPTSLRRPLLALYLALAAAAVGVAGWLAYHQGEGYIPALAAAKDLGLRERPHVRGFIATLEDCGYQLFPWLPLILLGALQPGRARWPALWLCAGLLMVSAWSLLYGAQPVPLTVPAAVLAATAVARLTAPTTSPAARRFALVLALAGCWIFAKDARRTPSRIGIALLPAKGEHVYPAAALGAPDLLAGLAGGAALALVLAAMSSRPCPSVQGASRMSRGLLRLRARLPAWLPAAVVLAALARQTWAYAGDLLPRTSEKYSLLRPLTRYQTWVAAGELTGPLGVYRVTDPGVELYGPAADARAPLATREALNTRLRQGTPTAALLRLSELPALVQTARGGQFPLYVLDASNRDVVLVANALPAGAEDLNPIKRVLFDAPPTLAHPTLLRFEDYVEVIAWEWDEPLVRGREVELRVVLRALKPLPSGSKITVRLQKGKLSRVNPMPHDLVENLYPPQYWRAGDYLLHRFRVQVPTLEVLPGPHEVVIGLRRTEHANYKITVPEGDRGEHGVRVFPGAHEFAVVGEIEVW